jgi:hypothetical protein
VVALAQLRARDVLAQGDAAEEAEARLGRRLLVDARDGLMFGWSGATPERTRPNGVGSASSRSTSKPAASSFSQA